MRSDTLPDGADTNTQADKWDRRHAAAEGIGDAAAVLRHNLHLLPVGGGGKALDLACGRGASALLLAGCGMQTHAWDISLVALERLRVEALETGLTVTTEYRDVVSSPPPPNSFDLILVSYFLERSLAPAIMSALRPGGLLFYQTFCRNAVSDRGPVNPGYRLAGNELLRLFSPLEVRFYREEGRLGDTAKGERDIAMLVAEQGCG